MSLTPKCNISFRSLVIAACLFGPSRRKYRQTIVLKNKFGRKSVDSADRYQQRRLSSN